MFIHKLSCKSDVLILLSETKPHQDVLKEENIKIEAISEVKGVRGNWKQV